MAFINVFKVHINKSRIAFLMITVILWHIPVLSVVAQYVIIFQEVDESLLAEKPNIYCHFAQGIGEPKYMKVKSWESLAVLLQDALMSYNDLVAAINLVLFEDAMMHVCR
jgi:hypothetical protein